MYKSDIIRPKLIEELRKKVQSKNYDKYLLSINIRNLRVFENATIRFDFPITAIIGANGSGKSTILMASACIYRDVKPSDFFANSSEDNISNASIEYTLIDRSERRDGETRRSISFRERKWSRKKIFDRTVKYFGVRRTVPPAERKELYRLRSSNIVPDERIELEEKEVRIINRILGLNSTYELTQFNKVKKELFVGASNSVKYSEFHFGAGESSITRLVYELERVVPTNSLILIEEIENGLHPLALKRLIEYLFEVTKRKRLQIIFTTHSPIAVEMLPEEAVWYCSNGTVNQGKVNIETLRAITGEVEKRIIVFTEDEFTKELVTTLIRQEKEFYLLDAIEIYPAGGNGEVKRFTTSFNENPARGNKIAIGILDGDVDIHEDYRYLIKLPGGMPELEVWETVMSNINSEIGKIAIALGFDFHRDQDWIIEKLNEANRDCADRHLIYAKAGEKLGYIGEPAVRNIFISTYVRLKAQELSYILNFIRQVFNEASSSSSSSQS